MTRKGGGQPRECSVLEARAYDRREDSALTKAAERVRKVRVETAHFGSWSPCTSGIFSLAF